MSSPNTYVHPPPPEMPPWLSRLYQDDELEDQDIAPDALRLAPMYVREILWSFSEKVVGAWPSKGGITSQACRIFERYCPAIVRRYEDLPSNEWEVKKAEFKQKTLLLLAVCLMLASKMESTQSHITGSALLRALLAYGKSYNLRDINAAEWDVFIAIGYRIPLWTNVQKIHMFVMELGLSERMLRPAGLIMDMLDLQMPVVCQRFKIHAVGAPQLVASPSEAGPSQSPLAGETRIRSMHLVAGALLATVRYTRASTTDVAPVVASWSRAPVGYVRWLANVIFHLVIEHVTEHKGKRHRDSVDSSDDETRDAEAKRHRRC